MSRPRNSHSVRASTHYVLSLRGANGSPDAALIQELRSYDGLRKAPGEKRWTPKRLRSMIKTMLAQPNSGLRRDPVTQNLISDLQLGSPEFACLGAGHLQTQESVVAALSTPTTTLAVFSAVEAIYEASAVLPLVPVFRNFEVALRVGQRHEFGAIGTFYCAGGALRTGQGCN